ncbi:RNA polymerase sigma-70 factor (ECF subfamily) [Fontibacillus solani]|uniref:RNA polymerase sigma-70 factor (ECF subfamily) n=1 Tax=Fontibacillus solani TaxID=1572857 RepID=A0A7W3XQN3_9BACL|nr:RNA polymerase sigma factor [Fontibacillus solani]MBA9084827.1 RNA polymerase sigma-70 factor (ECF subfamily) [Fontibacillus solani]
MISDQKLTQRMADGEQEAFELLVTRYHGPLLSYVTQQLKDRSKAEDIVQETFIRLIRHLRKYGQLEQLRPWLYKVALNLCRDYWRSAAYRSEQTAVDEFPDEADPSFGAEELLERQETVEQISDSLSWLPDVQQDVIRMRFFHDLKLHEIAELLDIPLSSVKSHLYGALRKLKRALTKKNDVASFGSGRRSKSNEEAEVTLHETLH